MCPGLSGVYMARYCRSTLRSRVLPLIQGAASKGLLAEGGGRSRGKVSRMRRSGSRRACGALPSWGDRLRAAGSASKPLQIGDLSDKILIVSVTFWARRFFPWRSKIPCTSQHCAQIRSAHSNLLKLEKRRPMTALAREAVDEFLQRHGRGPSEARETNRLPTQGEGEHPPGSGSLDLRD